ncbi:MAG: glycosyltransferase family 9 protein [bacterium]|nr:glycosyltransferase family 9 protein [bacterium]
MALNLEEIKKILIIGSDDIGYNLLLTPAIKKIKDIYKNSEIEILIGQKSLDFVIENPWFSKYFVYKKTNYFCLLNILRKQKYDLIIDFKNTLLPFCLKSKYKLTFFTKGFLSEKIYVHESEKIMSFIEPFLGKGELKLFFPVSNKYRDKIKEIFNSIEIKNSDLIVVLNPGSEYIYKRWDKKKFAELGKKLIKAYDAKIIIVGLENDEKITKEVKELIGDSNVFDFGGKTSLREVFAIFELSDLVVTNESYYMYLACAADTDIVAIYGPGNPYRYGPIGEKKFVVHSKIDCFPCINSKKCKINFQCLKEIEVEDVFKYCALILDEKCQPRLFEI